MRTLTIRQLHRWGSVVFTVAVIVNFAALFTLGPAQEGIRTGIGFAALAPLFLLLGTGLYLFALPYLPRRRAPAGG